MLGSASTAYTMPWGSLEASTAVRLPEPAPASMTISFPRQARSSISFLPQSSWTSLVSLSYSGAFHSPAVKSRTPGLSGLKDVDLGEVVLLPAHWAGVDVLVKLVQVSNIELEGAFLAEATFQRLQSH